MKRLLRISFDTLLLTTIPIIMWILLGLIVNKDIANVFTLTFPIQYITSFLLVIFGIGPNVNAYKNDLKEIIDTNILVGTICGFIITVLLIIFVDNYINIMSMNPDIYRLYSIYSFSLMYIQYVLKLICQKLYYSNRISNSNKITMIFSMSNLLAITLFSLIIKSHEIAIILTLLVDVIIISYIYGRYVKIEFNKCNIISNMKLVSNDLMDRMGMFIIYFIGWQNTFEFGEIYLVAINFETLIMDAQWDMSESIITAATVDSSKNKLNYKKSIKNAYRLIGLLLLSTAVMGIILYYYYQPQLWIISIFLGVQVFNMLVYPKIWIKQQYCQINYSRKIVITNEFIGKCIRIVCSFLLTPFCTYIGQFLNAIYQFFMYNIIYRKKYVVKDEMLSMIDK